MVASNLGSITVHPRARGEHFIFSRFHASLSGSSPRSRGTPPHCPPRDIDPRFIPALAGNTATGTPCHCESTVHPRARGEHHGPGEVADRPYGSSPRSRGTHHEGGLYYYRTRFIPALAGNTRAVSCRCRLVAVHPRARGEHSSLILLFYQANLPLLNSTDFF